MKFTVRLFNPATLAVSETTVDAASQEAVLSAFATADAVVLAVRRQSGTVNWLKPASRKRFAVALWCRELKTLLAAGMTVVEALETLRLQSADPAGTGPDVVLVERLHQGQSLSQAMAGLGVFPVVLMAAVKASERTSTLTAALDDYLHYDDMMDALKRQMVSAAIYPSLVLALGGVISFFLLAFVMPRFATTYADLAGRAGWATDLLMGFSALLQAQGAYVGLGLAAALAWLVLQWRAGRVQRAAMRAVGHAPLLQRRLDEFQLAKLYQSMALMIRGGYTLDEALQISSTLGLGERLSQAIGLAREQVAQGRRISQCFAELGLADLVSHRLLAVGERSGNFERVLEAVAERHAKSFESFVHRAARLIEPLLLLLVAAVVGGIVVAMYLPIFDIATSIR